MILPAIISPAVPGTKGRLPGVARLPVFSGVSAGFIGSSGDQTTFSFLTPLLRRS